MDTLRNLLGLLGGLFILLSAGAHSLLGWPAQRAQLEKAQTPPDLIAAMSMGWQFGGAAMLAFGIITVAIFLHFLRGQRTLRRPALVIGLVYLGFTGWAVSVVGPLPFLSVFAVPGMLLVIGGFPAKVDGDLAPR